MEKTPVNELIREKRIEKKVTVDMIFKDIHIPSKFVYMIENGEWDKFPSEVHLKGFLKLYAEYLGIDPEIVERCIKEASEKGEEEPPRRKPAGPRSLKKLISPERSLYVLIILGAVLVILYLFILYLLPE